MEEPKKVDTTIVDPRPLMRQLAAMANVELSHCRRMVLVLDVADVPRLFTESFLDSQKSEYIVLEATKLQAEDRPIVVSTTSMQNKEYHTHGVVPRDSKE